MPTIDLAVTNSNEPRDLILGGQGDDILQGGSGEDFIFGQDGNDVLTVEPIVSPATCSLGEPATIRFRSFRTHDRCWEIRRELNSIARRRPR